MHFRFSSRWIVVFVLFISISRLTVATDASPAPAAATEPAEEKIAELLAVTPLAISTTGKVLSAVVNFNDVFVYDVNAGTNTLLHRSPVRGIGNLVYEVSSDGSRLATLEYSNNQTRVRVFDLNDPNYSSLLISETRALNGPPRFSPDGQYYSIAGRLDPQSWGLEHLWTFNLAEYTWDTTQGNPQPTGFYLNTVHGPPSVGANTRFGGSSLVPSSAWSADSTRLAFVVTSFDGRGNGTTLRIHNLLTQTTEEISGVQFTGRMDWPEGDYIYYLQSQGIAGTLFRFHVEKRASEAVTNDVADPRGLSFAPNGKWVAYGSASVAANTLFTTLFDLHAKKAIRLKGATSARFAADNETLLLQRTVLDIKKDEQPFWITTLSEVLAAQENGVVDVQKMQARLKPAGRSIPSYEPPKDKAAFSKKFVLENELLNQSGQYVVGSVSLKNVTDRYYTFMIPSFDSSHCVLKDDQGNVLAESFIRPEPGDATKQVVAAGNSLPLYCNVVLRQMPPSGTQAKFTMSLTGYEDRVTIEKDLTF